MYLQVCVCVCECVCVSVRGQEDSESVLRAPRFVCVCECVCVCVSVSIASSAHPERVHNSSPRGQCSLAAHTLAPPALGAEGALVHAAVTRRAARARVERLNRRRRHQQRPAAYWVSTEDAGSHDRACTQRTMRYGQCAREREHARTSTQQHSTRTGARTKRSLRRPPPHNHARRARAPRAPVHPPMRQRVASPTAAITL